MDVRALMMRADAAMAASRHDDALECLDRALLLSPGDADVLNAKGALLGGLGRFAEAAACFERAAVERPTDADLQYNIAYATQCQGRFEEALICYDRTLRLRPNYPEALNNRGLTLDALGRGDEAIANFRAALRLSPNDVPALNNLGRSLLHQGEPRAAIPCFARALGLDPMHSQAMEGLAAAYRLVERSDELALACRQIIADAPRAATAWVELGAALVTLSNPQDAKKCFARAVELAPRDAAVRGRIGRAMVEMGDLDAARASFKIANELHPESADFLHGLANVAKVAANDEMLAALTRLESRQQTLPVGERTILNFALGKALADVGEMEQSFSRYLEGNRLQRTRRKYDEAAALATMSETARLFSPAILERLAAASSNSSAPIFVLGMPRSGSTLVEQVLAAHKDVVAFGELKAFDSAILAVDERKRSSFPAWLPSLDAQDLSLLAHTYMSRVSEIARAQGSTVDLAGGARFVDKMPGNYHYVGLIRLVFPKAKIIHTRRNPVDTCLSCFQTLFEGLPFTNNLGELGRYYRQYNDLMAAWRSVLPPAAMLEIDYEAMVDDFENNARRLVEFCELPWDDACLSFHKADRPVRTASMAQVRQPLYTTSVRKWRPSDDILKPLLDGLAGAC